MTKTGVTLEPGAAKIISHDAPASYDSLDPDLLPPLDEVSAGKALIAFIGSIGGQVEKGDADSAYAILSQALTAAGHCPNRVNSAFHYHRNRQNIKVDPPGATARQTERISLAVDPIQMLTNWGKGRSRYSREARHITLLNQLKELMRSCGSGFTVTTNGSLSLKNVVVDVLCTELGASKKEAERVYRESILDDEVVKVVFIDNQDRKRGVYFGLAEFRDDPISETDDLVNNFKTMISKYTTTLRLHGARDRLGCAIFNETAGEFRTTDWQAGSYERLIRYQNRVRQELALLAREIAQINQIPRTIRRPAR